MANFRIPLNYTEHVNRAVHNLSTVKRTTMHPMLAIPLYSRYMFVGDEFYFETPQMLLQSQPTFAPIMGSFRLRVEWYFDSDANRYGWIDNNDTLSAEEVLQRRRHTFQFITRDTIDNLSSQTTFRALVDNHNPYIVGYGGLADYLGIPPGTMFQWSEDQSNFGNTLNLDYVFTYLNIIRTYHLNQQFPSIPYVSYLENRNNPFSMYDAKDLDDLFKMLRYFDNGWQFVDGVRPATDEEEFDGVLPVRYYETYNKFMAYMGNFTRSFGCLFCTQYEPDLFRNLLNDDVSSLKSIVSTNADGSFTIEQFRFKNRLQEIVDRILSVGTRRSDITRSRWGITSNKGRDIPQLICVRSEYIDTGLVTSTNAGTSVDAAGQRYDSVPGDFAGNINQRKFKKGRQKFTASEAGVLMAIVTVTPMVDYCQGLDRWLTENNFEDSFSPQMQQKGFEAVPLSDYVSIFDCSNDPDDFYVYPRSFDDSVGNQIAWLREMTATNRVHGEFSTGGKFETWVLKRQYVKPYFDTVRDSEGDYSVLKLTQPNITPYGNPLDWQYPFVAQSITDPNFYLQMEFDVKAVRPIGRRFMPTLG